MDGSRFPENDPQGAASRGLYEGNEDPKQREDGRQIGRLLPTTPLNGPQWGVGVIKNLIGASMSPSWLSAPGPMRYLGRSH